MKTINLIVIAFAFSIICHVVSQTTKGQEDKKINIKVVPSKSNKLTLDDLDEIKMEVLHDMNTQLRDLEDEMAEKERLKEKTLSSWTSTGAPIYLPRNPVAPSYLIPNSNRIYYADVNQNSFPNQNDRTKAPGNTMKFKELEDNLKDADEAVEELQKIQGNKGLQVSALTNEVENMKKIIQGAYNVKDASKNNYIQNTEHNNTEVDESNSKEETSPSEEIDEESKKVLNLPVQETSNSSKKNIPLGNAKPFAAKAMPQDAKLRTSQLNTGKNEKNDNINLAPRGSNMERNTIPSQNTFSNLKNSFPTINLGNLNGLARGNPNFPNAIVQNSNPPVLNLPKLPPGQRPQWIPINNGPIAHFPRNSPNTMADQKRVQPQRHDLSAYPHPPVSPFSPYPPYQPHPPLPPMPNSPIPPNNDLPQYPLPPPVTFQNQKINNILSNTNDPNQLLENFEKLVFISKLTGVDNTVNLNPQAKDAIKKILSHNGPLQHFYQQPFFKQIEVNDNDLLKQALDNKEQIDKVEQSQADLLRMSKNLKGF